MRLIVVSSLDFLYKAVSAALFGILLLVAFALTAGMGNEQYFAIYRYDYLLFYALGIQICLLYLKLESFAEAKVIAVFHLVGLVMELFLTHPNIASWHYPQSAVFKLWTVPLFAGFMYSAVGSFFARALKLYQVQFLNLPAWWSMGILALVSYANFMTKSFIPDIRWLLFALSTYLFWSTKVVFQLKYHRMQLPMLVILWLMAGLIWVAENISTFYQIWLYPTQIEQWHMVGWGKLGSWYLLLLLSLVMVMAILGRRDANKTWQLKALD